MKKNNKPAAKRYMKTVGMVMASVMVLSSTTGQMVYAETAKDQKDTQDGEKKEEKITVYLNGQTGNDKKSGESPEEAVKSFKKAAELAGESGVIRICGTVTVEDEETWELPSGVSIRRAKDFEEALDSGKRKPETGQCPYVHRRHYRRRQGGRCSGKRKCLCSQSDHRKRSESIIGNFAGRMRRRRCIFLERRGYSSVRIRDGLSGGFPSV